MPIVQSPSALQLLEWVGSVLEGFGQDRPGHAFLTIAGPIKAALEKAPPAKGALTGFIAKGILAFLGRGGYLRHVMAVDDSRAAHYEALDNALQIINRHGDRYSLSLVSSRDRKDVDVVGNDRVMYLLMDTLSLEGTPEWLIVEAATDTKAGVRSGVGSRGRAESLASQGNDLFRWIDVSVRKEYGWSERTKWEEMLLGAEGRPGGRDMIQRFPPASSRPNGIPLTLERYDEERQQALVEQRQQLFARRRKAMFWNLGHGYRYRQVFTVEAIDDIARLGKYYSDQPRTRELSKEGRIAFLRECVRLLQDFPGTYEVVLVEDAELQEALPSGASWMVKWDISSGSPRAEAFGYLPGRRGSQESSGSEPAAVAALSGTGGVGLSEVGTRVNVVVSDDLASQGVAEKIDEWWKRWARGRSSDKLREEAVAVLGRAISRAEVPGQSPSPNPSRKRKLTSERYGKPQHHLDASEPFPASRRDERHGVR